MFRIIRGRDQAEVEEIIARRDRRMKQAEAVVAPILEAVRRDGDRALVEYARKLDGLQARTVAVPPAALQKAAAELPVPFRRALEQSSAHVWEFCHIQMPRSWRKRVRPGLSVGQIVRPLDSVAAYIPGGRYPLPSTMMMTLIPAQVAGVKTRWPLRPARRSCWVRPDCWGWRISSTWEGRRPSPPSPSAPKPSPGPTV
jgi:histidinol dehydrogenase